MALRAVYVLSLDDRDTTRTERSKKLARVAEQVTTANRAVGTNPRNKTAAQLDRKIHTIIAKHRYLSLLTCTITDHNGRPQATVVPDASALEQLRLQDGRYMLVTNDHQITPDEVLYAYKRQHLVEGRFHHFKGPIEVRPIFLKNNKRIAALLAIISIALLIYALVERQVRRAIDNLTQSQQRLLRQHTGLITGRKILNQLGDLTAARTRDGPYKITQPRPIQDLLLTILTP